MSTTPSGLDPASDAGRAATAETVGPRVWQACLPCRRKKVKCDGKQPCHNCSSRDHVCDYPGSNDNASVSRHYGPSFEVRCQQMGALCERLEGLVGQLSHSLSAFQQEGATNNAQQDLIQAASVLRSMPEIRENRHSLSEARNMTDNLENVSDDLDSEIETPCYDDAQGGALVKDSYGHFRFVGGATNSLLIEAVQSVSPKTTIGSNNDQGTTQEDLLEMPFFVQGKVWPELPFLPKPEQLSRPPHYVAELLIKLYFDQLHYKFPVLFKPYFMKRYHQILRSGSRSQVEERRFLLIFYAVCACASSLLPSASQSGFPGIEYYEKALLLYYASTGEASLERVQCLALLGSCAAGWNTLTQSWMLAGQAVRAAQDIGLHLGDRLVLLRTRQEVSSTDANTATRDSGGTRANDLLKQQISRRIWWSVYSLDRITSVCLGRPLAAHDSDSQSQLPLNLNDEELDSQSSGIDNSRNTSSSSSIPAITGFLALARLSHIAGKIHQLSSPFRMHELASADSVRRQKLVDRVLKYDHALRAWSESLPDSLRFSGQRCENDEPPDFGINLVNHIVQAGSYINLYRYFVGNSTVGATASDDTWISNLEAVDQCTNNAKSCIQAAAYVADYVPPSQYLAICVHYLTLSAVVLLRMPRESSAGTIVEDANKCINILKGLEERWSGATRSRAIVERLKAQYVKNVCGEGELGIDISWLTQDHNGNSPEKRPFSSFDHSDGLAFGGEQPYLDQLLGSDLFGLDSSEPAPFGSWGGI